MEEKIYEILIENRVMQASAFDTAKYIASHFREFMHWIIDEQEIFKGELMEKYIINDNPHVNGHKLETLDELYNYWIKEVKK